MTTKRTYWTNSSKRTKQIIYPIFMECAGECEEDAFWKDIFQKASTGTFPKKFQYKNGLLVHESNGKVSKLPILGETHEIVEKFKSFVHECSGISSKKDALLRAKREQEITRGRKIIITSWKSKNCNKTIKEQMLREYLREKFNQYDFSQERKAEIKMKIDSQRSNKTLKPDDFIVEDKKLVEIKGIEWKENMVLFTKKRRKTKSTTKKTSQQKKIMDPFFHQARAYISTLKNTRC